MKPSAAKQAVGACIKAGRPCMLWGPPGLGKSAIVGQVAAEQGRRLYDVRAVLLDPVDLRGIPSVNGGGLAHWNPPAWLPQPDDGPGLLFLDELPQAPASVQNACSQLLLDRQLGEYTLPDDVVMVAAGNRQTDRAATVRQPSHISNRLIHLEIEPDVDDWAAWALAVGLPTELIAFCRFRRDLLHRFEPRADDRAFPTPRSWAFVADLLAAGMPEAAEFDLIRGAVGEGAAAEFVGFLRIFRSLPNPDRVLMHPDTAEVPTDPATLFALCGALAHKASEQNADRFFLYAMRLPDDFSVLMVHDATRTKPGLCESRGFIEWSTRFKEVVF